VDNIPIEEAVYVLNISDGKFYDALKGIAYTSFFLLLLDRSNRKGLVEQIRQNQSSGNNYSNLRFDMGNLGNILRANDQEKEKHKTFSFFKNILTFEIDLYY